jgi:hypothetical protein
MIHAATQKSSPFGSENKPLINATFVHIKSRKGGGGMFRIFPRLSFFWLSFGYRYAAGLRSVRQPPANKIRYNLQLNITRLRLQQYVYNVRLIIIILFLIFI